MLPLNVCFNTSLCVFSETEGQEVKVGEYNAIADVLDLNNNSIRFQGVNTTDMTDNTEQESWSYCEVMWFTLTLLYLAVKETSQVRLQSNWQIICTYAAQTSSSRSLTPSTTYRQGTTHTGDSLFLHCSKLSFRPAKLFTGPFFTPHVLSCVDILCNLFNPPGYPFLHHPCPRYRNSQAVPSETLVSTSLTTVSGYV